MKRQEDTSKQGYTSTLTAFNKDEPEDIKSKIKTELGYDSDLVIDTDDEKKLDLMPELKREQEIDERRKKREILIARYDFVKK